MALYRLSGTARPNTDWTTEVVLERDDNGAVTKSVSASGASELSKEDVSFLEEQGFVLEKVSKEDAEKLAAAQPAAGDDVAGAAPVFGGAGEETDRNS